MKSSLRSRSYFGGVGQAAGYSAKENKKLLQFLCWRSCICYSSVSTTAHHRAAGKLM